VWQARERLRGVVRRTPVLTHLLLDDRFGSSIHVKAEHLQLTGAFKFRGMYSKISSLAATDRKRGVVTVSSGNAAQGLALAGRLLDAPCVVVMPDDVAPVKLAAVQALGARVLQLPGTSDALFRHAESLADQERMNFVHPFDQPEVIAGQATVGLELMEDLGDADLVLMPTSGGGMLSGVSLVVKSLSPHTKVIGVQPEGATSVYAALAAGGPTPVPVDTVADALTAATCGRLTFDLISHYADDVLLVSDEDIFEAVRILWKAARMVVETGGATGLAALLRYPELRKGRVAVITSGGNIDPRQFAHIIGGGSVADWRVSARVL
jgi:threonine dehydratase